MGLSSIGGLGDIASIIDKVADAVADISQPSQFPPGFNLDLPGFGDLINPDIGFRPPLPPAIGDLINPDIDLKPPFPGGLLGDLVRGSR